jgi:hypothetical protein
VARRVFAALGLSWKKILQIRVVPVQPALNFWLAAQCRLSGSARYASTRPGHFGGRLAGKDEAAIPALLDVSPRL